MLTEIIKNLNWQRDMYYHSQTSIAQMSVINVNKSEVCHRHEAYRLLNFFNENARKLRIK